MPQLSAGDRIDPATKLLRPVEVAELLGVTTRTVRHLAETGDLRKVKLGTRSTRYRLADIERFIAERTYSSNQQVAGDDSV
jgi:excisionase family DNA binding protein